MEELYSAFLFLGFIHFVENLASICWVTPQMAQPPELCQSEARSFFQVSYVVPRPKNFGHLLLSAAFSSHSGELNQKYSNQDLSCHPPGTPVPQVEA